MSWLRFMTLYSFRKYNPDWCVQLYVAKESGGGIKGWKDGHQQDNFTYKGESYYDRIKELNVDIIPWELKREGHPNENTKWASIPPSQKSNFFKWGQLATQGGVYADMDIVFTGSLSNLYDRMNAQRTDTALTYVARPGYFSIGFMASAPNNVFFKAAYENCFNAFDKDQYQGAGVLTLYKKWKNLDAVRSKFPKLKIYNVSMSYIHFLDSFNIPKIFNGDYTGWMKKDTIGLHWYAGHPMAQKFNTEVNASNYKSFNHTLGILLKRVLDK